MKFEPKNKKTVLLTGGTGTFGRVLASELLQHDDIELILLVRARSSEEAFKRVQKILEGRRERAEVFCSDLTQQLLGLSEADYADLSRRVTHILHAAASVRFNHPLEVARYYNVRTTEQIVSFAKGCLNLVRFGFVSTALVAGNRSGVIMEDEFEHNAGFKNTYEQSKYESEALVRASAKKLPVAIFRPPLIVTPTTVDSNAFSKNKNALSVGISLVINGVLRFLPGTEYSVVDVVNGKTAAEKIAQLMLKSSLAHKVYHITNGEYAPTIKIICSLIEKKIGGSISLKFCGPMDKYNEEVHDIPWYQFRMRRAYKKISSFIPELAYSKIYDNAHTLKELHIPNLGDKPIDTVNSIINKEAWNLSV